MKWCISHTNKDIPLLRADAVACGRRQRCVWEKGFIQTATYCINLSCEDQLFCFHLDSLKPPSSLCLVIPCEMIFGRSWTPPAQNYNSNLSQTELWQRQHDYDRVGVLARKVISELRVARTWFWLVSVKLCITDVVVSRSPVLFEHKTLSVCGGHEGVEGDVKWSTEGRGGEMRREEERRGEDEDGWASSC